MPKSESNNTIFYNKNQAFKFDFSAEETSSDGKSFFAKNAHPDKNCRDEHFSDEHISLS